eukprot:6196877-Pleurochrysis_carterae.AAC.1
MGGARRRPQLVSPAARVRVEPCVRRQARRIERLRLKGGGRFSTRRRNGHSQTALATCRANAKLTEWQGRQQDQSE